MTQTPVERVPYWGKPDEQVWRAVGRPDLSWNPPPPPPPPIIWAGSVHTQTFAAVPTYPIPTDGTQVVYVSPSGSDTGAGTLASPFKTIQHAISASSTLSGAVLVLRAGSYHESLTTPSTKTLTLQAYPGELVTLDGAKVYSSWTSNGDGTYWAAYTIDFTRFDTTGYSGSDALRNYPDQVWVDGVALTQVADGTKPAAGQFSVDQTANRLTIYGNPAGHTVRVSELATALIGSGRLDCYGIWFRRYSPQSVTYPNAMIFMGGNSAGNIFENCVFSESGMAGLSLTKPDCVVRSCTFQDLGYTGLFWTQADGLTVQGNLFRRLNRGRWSPQPATGGMKGTRTGSSPLNQFSISDNYITDVPGSNGIWLDVSCIQFSITNNVVDGSGLTSMQYGIVVEESDGGNIGGVQTAAYIVGNKISGCSAGAIRVLDTGWTRVWNNDVRDNNIGIYAQQDRAQNSGTQVAAGNRTNAECPWHTVHNEYVNNIISPSAGGTYKIQFMSYDNGPKVDKGWDQIDLLAGNRFVPDPTGGSMAQLGNLGATTSLRTTFHTLAALAASDSTVGGPPGAKLGTNYQASDLGDPTTYGVPLTAVVAAAVRGSTGDILVGPNTDKLPIPIDQKVA